MIVYNLMHVCLPNVSKSYSFLLVYSQHLTLQTKSHNLLIELQANRQAVNLLIFPD